MSDLDLAELSRKIGKEVNKFINSEEMKGLQKDIRETVEKTVDGVRHTAKTASDFINQDIEIRLGNEKQGGGQAPPKTATRTAIWQEQKRQQEAQQNKEKLRRLAEEKQLPIVKRPRGSVSSILMLVLGSCGAVAFWIVALLLFALLAVLEMDFLGFGRVSAILSAVIASACTITAAAGGKIRKRINRFKSYVKAIGKKEVCSIEDLARATGDSTGSVLKELKKMLRKNWFMEGRLDNKETCLILTKEAYQHYLDALAEQERQRLEAVRQAKEQELLEQDPVRKQLKIAIAEGDEYIRRIREINDDIPGEEISRKLYRLENVCKRIFDYVEENPEKLPDIRKFMSYYLPTTLKLVETYHEFGNQPVQGENIRAAKLEIEGTLDDINAAFEKMFDKLFEDDALDVSTDISVLSTMLAQEGLLEDDFTIKN